MSVRVRVREMINVTRGVEREESLLNGGGRSKNRQRLYRLRLFWLHTILKNPLRNKLTI